MGQLSFNRRPNHNFVVSEAVGQLHFHPV